MPPGKSHHRHRRGHHHERPGRPRPPRRPLFYVEHGALYAALDEEPSAPPTLVWYPETLETYLQGRWATEVGTHDRLAQGELDSVEAHLRALHHNLLLLSLEHFLDPLLAGHPWPWDRPQEFRNVVEALEWDPGGAAATAVFATFDPVFQRVLEREMRKE